MATVNVQKYIGVFDSGIGGLSVLKELLHELPNENFVYLGDTARVPYGTRSPEVIRQFALEDVKFLSQFPLKAVVIACNTVSAVALDDVREAVDVPVFDVVSAGEFAVRGVERFGLVGTRATISSSAYSGAFWRKACPLLVPLVEEGILSGELPRLAVENYLEDMPSLSHLVLGCTHYPLLATVFDEVAREVVGEPVTLINPGRVLALQLREFLGNRASLRGDRFPESPERLYYVTDLTPRFEETAGLFLGRPIELRRCGCLDPATPFLYP